MKKRTEVCYSYSVKFVNRLLDRHTMYQVIIAILVSWFMLALGAAAIGQLSFSVTAMLVSMAVLSLSAVTTHFGCKFVTKAPTSLGSTIITVLILFFIFDPSLHISDLAGLAGVAAMAIVSKYVIAYRHLHLVNPVAIAAVLAGLLGFAYATWWVATPVMVISIAIGGILIVLKIDRNAMVAAGLLVASLGYLALAWLGDSVSFAGYLQYLISAPLLFFMFVMVTEPLTTPAGQRRQIAYGALIGILMNIPFSFGPLYSSPELALVIANLAFYPFSLRSRLTLKLVEKDYLSENTVEYCFNPSHSFSFKPGQYLEWTLPHERADQRGICRYFTIASSPNEPLVRLTVRLSENVTRLKQEQQDLLDDYSASDSKVTKKMLEDKIEALEKRIGKATEERDKIEIQERDIKSFVRYTKDLVEHPVKKLANNKNPLFQKALFDLVFDEPLTYAQIVSGTPKLSFIFKLSNTKDSAKTSLVKKY